MNSLKLCSPEEESQMLIYHSQLPTRLINAILGEGIYTVAELCSYTYEEIYSVKGIGHLSMLELRDYLQARKLHFRSMR